MAFRAQRFSGLLRNGSQLPDGFSVQRTVHGHLVLVPLKSGFFSGFFAITLKFITYPQFIFLHQRMDTRCLASTETLLAVKLGLI